MIEERDHFKLLGLTISNTLSFRKHVEDITKKLRITVGLIKRLSFRVSIKALKTVIQSKIIGKLAYGGFLFLVPHINNVLGITKAYTTRVGNGPFPSELNNKTGELLGKIGHEFGVVTGRKRRCGWFDAVIVNYTVKLSGINGIALTKLDVLDTFKEIKICVGYQINKTKIIIK